MLCVSDFPSLLMIPPQQKQLASKSKSQLYNVKSSKQNASPSLKLPPCDIIKLFSLEHKLSDIYRPTIVKFMPFPINQASSSIIFRHDGFYKHVTKVIYISYIYKLDISTSLWGWNVTQRV